MSTVAVIGGGISGLSCAYYLKSLGQSKIKYLFLLEKAPRFGGWIQTTKFEDGAVCEHGPRSIRLAGAAGYNAISLIEELHLTYDVLPLTTRDASVSNRLILARNNLCLIPNSLKHVLRVTPPFSKPLYHFLLHDLRTSKCTLPDESVYSFAERRFDKELADYVFDPLCRGITAGDAREISMKSLMPQFYNMEKEYGSVVKGMIKSLKSATNMSEFENSKLLYQARKEVWRLWSLKYGLGQLVDALALSIEECKFADIHVNAECTGIVFKNNHAYIMVDGEEIVVDHVFSCIPASNLSFLLSQYNSLSNFLQSIPFVTVAVVYLEYNEFILRHEAFGFLTPSFEEAKVLGIVFDSTCFPQHNGQARTRITCMMGGKWFNSIFGSSPSTEKVLKVAIEEASKHLKTDAHPVRYHVDIHKDCIPQYTVGHTDKIEKIKLEVKKHNLCLSLLGASFDGISVPDCIYNAKVVVKEFLSDLKVPIT